VQIGQLIKHNKLPRSRTKTGASIFRTGQVKRIYVSPDPQGLTAGALVVVNPTAYSVVPAEIGDKIANASPAWSLKRPGTDHPGGRSLCRLSGAGRFDLVASAACHGEMRHGK
jgi:hypothetical protein